MSTHIRNKKKKKAAKNDENAVFFCQNSFWVRFVTELLGILSKQISKTKHFDTKKFDFRSKLIFFNFIFY
jgi:hypothetical protein